MLNFLVILKAKHFMCSTKYQVMTRFHWCKPLCNIFYAFFQADERPLCIKLPVHNNFFHVVKTISRACTISYLITHFLALGP